MVFFLFCCLGLGRFFGVGGRAYGVVQACNILHVGTARRTADSRCLSYCILFFHGVRSISMAMSNTTCSFTQASTSFSEEIVATLFFSFKYSCLFCHSYMHVLLRDYAWYVINLTHIDLFINQVTTLYNLKGKMELYPLCLPSRPPDVCQPCSRLCSVLVSDPSSSMWYRRCFHIKPSWLTVACFKGYVIRLQHIFNFWLLHAILSIVLDYIGLYFPLLYYFWD